MNIRKICGLGYFDRIIIDGYMMPMYNSKGLVLSSDENIITAMDNNRTSYENCVGKLRINIAGEAINFETKLEIDKMREHREHQLGLFRQKIGTVDRYNIGYADIIILKDPKLLGNDIMHNETSEDDIIRMVQTDDEVNILLEALKIQKKYIKSNKCASIAIVDRLLVDKEFRRCGISSWIHNNLIDIIKIYGLIDIGCILLMPGDFTCKANEDFDMSEKEYVKMLTYHYKEMGYKFINNDIMCKKQ